MLKEEMIYEDALGVIERHFKGEVVSQTSLAIATMILQTVWVKIYENRLETERAKESDTWKQELQTDE